MCVCACLLSILYVCMSVCVFVCVRVFFMCVCVSIYIYCGKQCILSVFRNTFTQRIPTYLRTFQHTQNTSSVQTCTVHLWLCVHLHHLHRNTDRRPCPVQAPRTPIRESGIHTQSTPIYSLCSSLCAIPRGPPDNGRS